MPHIVLGITGSIGAYKTGDLVRELRARACDVSCILTAEAQHFITPLTLQALSGRKVYTDLFALEDPHIVHTTLADTADLLVIAPATANILGKLAHGLADDLLTCVALATHAPILIAPAMNVHMYRHPMVQANVSRLKALGYAFVGPAYGSLACGYEGIGHLAEADDIIRAAWPLATKKHSTPAGRSPRPSRRRPSTRA